MSDLTKILDDYLTEGQRKDLKSVALASLGLGVGIPLVKDIFKPQTPLIMPPSDLSAEIPVSEEDMTSRLPEYSRPTSKRTNTKLQNLKNFSPSSKLKEKRAFDYKDLTNPYYASAAIAALAAPYAIGNYLSDKVISYKNNADKAEELDAAKSDFAKALLEANSNRLNRNVEAENPQAQAYSDIYNTAKTLSGRAVGKAKSLFKKNKAEGEIPVELLKAGAFNQSSFVNDLEKLAQVTIKKADSLFHDEKGEVNSLGKLYNWTIDTFKGSPLDLGKGGYFDRHTAPGTKGNATGNVVDEIVNFGTSAAKSLGDKAKDAYGIGTDLLKGYGGIALATALLGGGIGTYYGHRAAAKEDTGTADSYRYLSEYLKRRQEEGLPVSVTPTPVAKAKKPWYAL